MSNDNQKILKRLIFGCLGIIILIFASLIFSLIQGAGWRPIIAGLPVYATFFILITYRFIRYIILEKHNKRQKTNHRS